MTATALSEKLYELRLERNLGVRELGRLVDVSGMHISNLEKGKSMPSTELVQRLAVALSTSADELLFLAGQVDPDVVEVIHNNPLSVPSFLRSAKNLTPKQWELLQAQVDEMAKKTRRKK